VRRPPAPVPRKLWHREGRTDPGIEAYTAATDVELDRGFLPYEIYGSLAHASGLRNIGLLEEGELRAVRAELRKLLSRAGSFRIRPAQEDIHTALEQYLTRHLGATGAKIQAGRSRNDQVQTNLRLYLKDQLLRLQKLALEASAAWERFGKRYDHLPFPGYTHLQRAMPTTLGHWAASHAEALLEACGPFGFAYEEADRCPLGSAAGFGAPLPLDRRHVARLLGFRRVQRNTLRVQSARPRVEAAALFALAAVGRDLAVLAWDVSLFTTAEFGFFTLDPSVTTGSSLMPQKRNPDLVELTRARAALFPGWLAQILEIGSLPSGYHRDYQTTKKPLVDAVRTMSEMLDIAARLPEAIRVREERCRAAVSGEMLAAARALALARRGVPFREAYGRIAREVRKDAPRGPIARGLELPAYPGAPGNPDWNGIARDRAELWRKIRAERRRLESRWRALLEG
jgi:argininosuccinate lyase